MSSVRTNKTPIHCPSDGCYNIGAEAFGINLRRFGIRDLYLEDMRQLPKFVGKNIKLHCRECGHAFTLQNYDFSITH